MPVCNRLPAQVPATDQLAGIHEQLSAVREADGQPKCGGGATIAFLASEYSSYLDWEKVISVSSQATMTDTEPEDSRNEAYWSFFPGPRRMSAERRDCALYPVRDIATARACSPAALYHHFSSKKRWSTRGAAEVQELAISPLFAKSLMLSAIQLGLRGLFMSRFDAIDTGNHAQVVSTR